jgi:hypothetical protein
MILLSAPGYGPPFKKNETLRHFTDARKQKTIHKYNKNWKDFDFGLDGFEKKVNEKVGGGGGGHEINWKKQMKKDIIQLFRGDGSWYENLDNTVFKIQQTIVGQLFPFLAFGGGGDTPPKGGEEVVGGENDKVLKNSVFAILKYCMESVATTSATTSATTTGTTTATTTANDDEELLEESAQIPDEDIDPDAAEILSIKEFETTNNENQAKNRSFQIKIPMNYYEKMNHDLHNIMTIGTEGQREVINHVEPKSYFEEDPMIESIDEEMDAEMNEKDDPEVIVNVPETLADGYPDLSRATVFVDPEAVKDNQNVDEIFYKNTREMVDETMFSNYQRVMTEEEAEILGVMSPMKLASLAMLKYCSVPVKGFWSNTVWNGLKNGLGVLGTGIYNAPVNVQKIGVNGVDYVKKGYDERQKRLRLEKEQNKLYANRKQAGLALLKYCLGYEKINNINNTNPIISVTNQTPEDNEKYKEKAFAILNYCLSEPSVSDNSSTITPYVNTAATVPDEIISAATVPYAVPYAVPEPDKQLEELKNVQFQREQRKAAGYSILKYCLEELGKRVDVPVTQTEEIAINPDNLPIENAEEPQKEEQENLVISSNPYLTQRVVPDVSTVTEKEKKVEEETDKYKEQSLAVLKYCLEYEDKLLRELSKGIADEVLNTGLNINVQENDDSTQVLNSPSVITSSLNPPVPSNLTYEDKLPTPPPFENKNVVQEKIVPPVPPTKEEKEEAAALEKQQQEVAAALLEQQNKEAAVTAAAAALEKQQQEAAAALLEQQNKEAAVTAAAAEKQAELEKEQEKQRQTAGFSMLKYCLDIMNTKSRPPPTVIPKLPLQDMISSNISNLNTPQTTERPLSERTLNNTAISTTPRINQYKKQLLAMIGLKYYLKLKKNSQENKEAVNKEDIIIEDIEEDNSPPSSSRSY